MCDPNGECLMTTATKSLMCRGKILFDISNMYNIYLFCSSKRFTISKSTQNRISSFTEINKQSISKTLSARVSSIRDIVEIRKRINEQVTNKKDGTFNRYIYLDRGNTWCLRICLFVCIITIIILLIIVSQNSNRLAALEGTQKYRKLYVDEILILILPQTPS